MNGGDTNGGGVALNGGDTDPGCNIAIGTHVSTCLKAIPVIRSVEHSTQFFCRDYISTILSSDFEIEIISWRSTGELIYQV